MFLTPDEIAQLTGRRKYRAQVRALRAMGIEHKTRADGSPVVLRSHVEKELDGITANAKTTEVEPNWGAM